MVELGLWRYYAQTKRTRHHPWCEDGAYALGLGVLMPHTMVGAKAAPHHVAAKNEFIHKQVLILYVLFVYLPVFVSTIPFFGRERCVFVFLFEKNRLGHPRRRPPARYLASQLAHSYIFWNQ